MVHILVRDLEGGVDTRKAGPQRVGLIVAHQFLGGEGVERAVWEQLQELTHTD